jgi:DNA polymerase (family 10)
MSTKSNGRTWTLEVAEQAAIEFMHRIRTNMGSGIGRMEVCGSIARRVPEVHDIDILAVSEEMKGTLARLTTPEGIPVDVYYTSEESWGAFQMFLTGSAAYNVMMRAKAKAKGFKLSQYGLFNRETGELVASKTEQEIYKALNIEHIPPTERSKEMGDRL